MKKFIIIFVALLYLSACDDSQNPLDPDEKEPSDNVVPFLWGHVGVRLGLPDKPEVSIRIKNESFDTTLIAVHNHPKGAYFWQIDNLKSGSYDFTFSADGRMTIHYPNIQYNSSVDTVNFQYIAPQEVFTDLYANPEQINFELLSHNVKIYLDSVYGSTKRYFIHSGDTIDVTKKDYSKLFTQLAYESEIQIAPIVTKSQEIFYHWQITNSNEMNFDLLPNTLNWDNRVFMKYNEIHNNYNVFALRRFEKEQDQILPSSSDLLDYGFNYSGLTFSEIRGIKNVQWEEGQTHPFIENDVYIHIVPYLQLRFTEKLKNYIVWPEEVVHYQDGRAFIKRTPKTYKFNKEVIRRDIDLGEVEVR